MMRDTIQTIIMRIISIERSVSQLERIDIPRTSSAWIALPYQNGWSNWTGFGPAWRGGMYRREGSRVWLCGVVSSVGSTSDLIATLPAGYRPAGEEMFIAPSASGWAQVRIAINGEVRSSGYGTWLSLAGISSSTVA